MHVESTAEEIKRLQRCLNDLVVVLALPAVWTRHEPSQIAHTLVDVLVRMLRLDFAYVRLSDSVDSAGTEWARSAERRDISPHEIGRTLERWLTAEPADPTAGVPNPVGDGVVSIAVFRLGVQEEVGRLIVASGRQDFPTRVERLLMQVAANQAATGLQESRHLRQQRQAAEEKARRELAQVARRTTLAAMTASIAHEIQQPLAAIVTNAQAGLRWLAREDADLDELRAALKEIVEAGRRATGIMANIRAMFRQDGQDAAPLDVNALVRDVLALVRAELESHQIVARQDLREDVPPVSGEPVPLQQVVLNLILNAVDAMSSLTDRPRELSIQTQPDGSDHVRITVTDAGTGIDPANVDRIFEAFFTTKPQGMGMGLSICRWIVEAHGGQLWVTPGVPHGSAFHVQLPRTR